MKPIAIDLGLSVRWADRDFGAEDIELDGSLFRASGKYGFRVEEVTEYLNKAIKKALGQRWRLPTEQEVMELMDNCQIDSVNFIRSLPDGKQSTVKGYKVKGKSEGRKYIFIKPAHRILFYKGESPAFWNINSGVINVPFCNNMTSYGRYEDYDLYEKDNIPFGHYYDARGRGLMIRPVTYEDTSGFDDFRRFFEYPLSQDWRFEKATPLPTVFPHTINKEYSPVEKKRRMEERVEMRERQRRQEEELARQRREMEEELARQRMEREEEERRQKEREEEQKRRERAARIRQNRPRNKYDTGSIVNWEKSLHPDQSVVRDSSTGTTYGYLNLENGHRYSIEHRINPLYRDIEYWKGRGDGDHSIYLDQTGTLQEMIQQVEQRDFEFSQNYYDLHGRIPDGLDF